MSTHLEAERVFQIISQELPKAGVKFLMIGGHAVNAYGHIRATQDIDFMVAAKDAQRVRRCMEENGFSNISEGENVMFFSRPDSPLRIDFLPVDEDTMAHLMFNSKEILYGGVTLRIPSLLDLVAMKLFALKVGHPRRKERDTSDIIHLAIENKLDLSRDLKPLCTQFANEGIYLALQKRLEEYTHA